MFLQALRLIGLLFRLIQKREPMPKFPKLLPKKNLPTLCDPVGGFPVLLNDGVKIIQEFNSVTPTSLAYSIYQMSHLSIDNPEHEGIIYNIEKTYQNFAARGFKFMIVSALGGYLTDDVLLNLNPDRPFITQDEAYALLGLVGIQAFVIKNPFAKETYYSFKKSLRFTLAFPKSSTSLLLREILNTLERR